MIKDNPILGELRISPCRGGPVDMQIRYGDTIMLNAEFDLGGAHDQADDMKKLTSHTEQHLVSIMVTRGKSHDGVE